MKSCGNGERAPLRTILQNFLNHVETLEKRKNGADDQYDKEFQELKLLSESLKGLPNYSCLEGEKEVNRRKNRYKDILPFDYTRVSLSEITGIPGSDYINANYIRGASGSHAYIASQGPLAHTVIDFWRMVIECDVQVIIMACNEEESGKHKCENYWVESEQESKPYGPYTVKLLKARRMCNDFNLRTMELTYTNAAGESVTRTVVQFHYWAWPDHGVPALVRPLLDMVRLIRDCQASETLPLLIHCSAGCGRTGTICAIDYVWGLLRAGKLTEDFSLFDLIAEMRRQRVAMVQTKDQYILVHRAVRELFIEQLRMIDAHPYENLDMNGHPLICPPQEIRIDPSYETIFVKESESEIVEVKEEEDICHEESAYQIPWTVLQYQSNSPVIDSVPPLPDKKRKVGGASGDVGNSDAVTISSKSNPPQSDLISKSTSDNISSTSNSKESSPPSSLERPLLKYDSDPSTEGSKEEEGNNKHVKSSPTPNHGGLVRKSSILKLRAFFEKSNSEPRGEKKSKSSHSSRKASSFRMKEAPSKFYRSLDGDDEEITPTLTHDPSKISPQSSTEYHDFAQQEKKSKLSVARGFDSVDSDSKNNSSGSSHANHKKGKDVKPNLPVKRSKSMKVYRGFDVRMESSSAKSEGRTASESSQPATASAQCDVVLSKTPSITYISSKENLHSSTRGTAQEPTKQSVVCSDYDNLDYYSAPLTTSSLDRGKDQRPPKHSAPACGSLDRNVNTAQIKIVPTYVNVLIRNQEAAHTSKLDDDTRQLLQDCQAYLMHSEPNEKTQTKDEQRLNPLEKKSRNRSLRERRHSFKQAVIPDPEDDSIARKMSSDDSSPPTAGSSESVCRTDEGSSESKSSRPSKKVHEYEAIWLSGADAIANPPSPSAAPAAVGTSEGNNDNSSGVLTKDSVFIQKSDEIRLLLNELRSGRQTDELERQMSPTPSKLPPPFPVSSRPDPTSPRLHPERVLCELQELVERANRNHEELVKTPTDMIPTVVASLSNSLAVTPPSPSANRKPAYVNYPQPHPRTESSKLSSPSSPIPTRYIMATPSTATSTASAIIAPIPIKLTSSVSPATNAKTSPHSQTSVTIINTPLHSPSTGAQSKSSSVSVNTPNARMSSPQLALRPPGSQNPANKTSPTSPSIPRRDLPTNAPAFRPPPPYPTNLFVKLPPLSKDLDKPQMPSVKSSPKMQRRMPPEYKDPPPVKRGLQPQPAQPVAPPRAKRHVNTPPGGSPSSAFPLGPPVPGRSFSITHPTGSSVPGIDVDAVAAVIAATSDNSPKARSGSGGSSSPTTAANKALSKALGKFQATAASFKTKFAQLSDAKDASGTSDSSNLASTPSSQPKMEREASFIKPTVVYVGDGITVVNTSETTTYVRKKQQYL